ncbi:MAG: Flavoredoxin [Bacteroidetes bacterium ADurb.Bin408]|nr:MAG: Flavoredoxin [Bacteroidetes bacterium ADurb.Bin408]
MTAAWGGLGFLWKKPVVYCFIRPTRYTYHFFENNDNFSVCFFDKTFKDALNYCGTHSGKDVDKIKQTGLIPIEGVCGTIIFEQARLALECKKIYFDDIKPAHFLDKDIDRLYDKDYHRMYIGEILSCLEKQ